MPRKANKKADSLNSTLVFEVAWEVCNQVEGIYTVVRSKAPAMMGNHSGIIEWWGRILTRLFNLN